MGKTVSLTAADGHAFDAYLSGADGARYGLVVIQEIFGVTGHIRAVCDRFAAQGYAVIAPALFDRVRPDVQLGYTPEDVQAGLALHAKLTDANAVADIAAALSAFGGKPTGVIGYCWGGTLAWQVASQTDRVRAAIGWYGGGIPEAKDATLKCPCSCTSARPIPASRSKVSRR
jgi:carboxymethylenebutenolidase